MAFKAIDLFYFALTKYIASEVTLEDIKKNLNIKSVKVKRRKGDVKVAYITKSAALDGSLNNKRLNKTALL